MVLSILLGTTNVFATDFKTWGDGTTWTLTKLASTEGSGVTMEGTTCLLSNTIIISAGDRFKMEGGLTVKMGEAVSLEVEGTASMSPSERSLFTRSEEGVVPGIVYLKCNEQQVVAVEHLDFEYVGLKYFASKGLDVKDCTFRYHKASTSNGTSALNLAGEGASFSVRECIFEYNGRSAIGGAANASNPILIENCFFQYNDAQNLNYPQLNLTCSPSIIIRNNKVIGDRTKTLGGGIMVADLLGLFTNSNTLIENNEVTDNRYGIALYCSQKAIVRNNQLLNNNTETNPMNGGSGINIYDPTGQQETMITGNYIEGSLWGVTIIGGKNINLGKTENPLADDYNPGGNTFYNNGFDGTIYDLYNNSVNTIYAQGNYWKTAATQDAEGIENVIYHKHDDPSLGEVIFAPWKSESSDQVNNINSNIENKEEIYSLSGILQQSAQKGINIIKRQGKRMKVIY